jgi:hypothetical protein
MYLLYFFKKLERPLFKSKRKTVQKTQINPIKQELRLLVVGPLGFEPRIAYAPGTYPEPC